MPKRRINAFVVGPKNGPRSQSQDRFDLYTSVKYGGTFAVVVLGPYYDEEEDCLYKSVGDAVWGTQEELEEMLKIGRKIYWEPDRAKAEEVADINADASEDKPKK